MGRFISSHPGWLTEVRLPAYAPDLNPVEGAWANMKNGLSNLAVRDVDQLAAIMKSRLKRIQYPTPSLLGVRHSLSCIDPGMPVCDCLGVSL